METVGQKLSGWAAETVRKHYKDDVALLISHTSLQLDKDVDKTGFSYYIPATNRANGLARTFIIDGIGYDLFPMPWESIERMADMKHYNTTCLADITESEILYARTDAEKQRFLALQSRQKANLQNPAYMLDRAYEWLKSAGELFREIVFAKEARIINQSAGYICDLLAIAIAFANGRYFRRGQTDQLREIASMEHVPDGFARLYEKIILEKDPDTKTLLCRKMIGTVKDYLDRLRPPASNPTPDFAELACWYQELIYTWRRVAHWCDEGNAINAYLWCCMLQNEIEEWGGRFGVRDRDILGYWDSGDLPALKSRAAEVQSAFADAIEAHGIKLDAYCDIDEFLAKNRP